MNRNGNGTAKHEAEVIALPEDEGWPPELLAKLQERMELLGDFIEDHGGHADLYALHSMQKQIFELCELYFAGLGPNKAKEVAEQIAPKWARFNELVESNRAKAQALLAVRRRPS
jgi:hypothetical protein